MNRTRRPALLLIACAFGLSLPMAAAADWSGVIKQDRLSVSLFSATSAGSLEGRPFGASRRLTHSAFDLSGFKPHPRKWMLDFTVRFADSAEPGLSTSAVRVTESAGFAASTPPVGEPRGNELLLRARYDF